MRQRSRRPGRRAAASRAAIAALCAAACSAGSGTAQVASLGSTTTSTGVDLGAILKIGRGIDEGGPQLIRAQEECQMLFDKLRAIP